MDRDWIGRKVSVFFDDGSKISRKIGILEKINNFFLVIKLDNTTEAIPLQRIIRVELWEK
ncbi:MAG: hypothetical protein QW228_06065 [Candidatus Aenigmatarchaeota archaeon]